jgi:hypothetical protein
VTIPAVLRTSLVLPLSVGMACVMESAKRVTAGWLARWCRATVAGLAVIGVTGLYAQPVAAHVGERGATAASIETQDAALGARIEVAAGKVADLDRRLN